MSSAVLEDRGSIDRQRLLVPAARSALLWRGTAQKSRTTGDAVFGLAIDDTTVAGASRDLINAARSQRLTRVVFANAHVVNELSHRPGYDRIVATADRIYADGSGMALAARLAGQPLADNVNGTDLFPRLAADAAAAGVTIFLLGGRPRVAEAARQRLLACMPGAPIVGSYHGFFEPGSLFEAQAIAAANASGAGIVLVGMGVPRQDEWIAANVHRLRAPVLAGVGGLFDFFAGSVSRAPHAWRVIGCEWVWRLALEPRRMARRYLIGNAVFVGRALVEAYRIRSARRRRAPGVAAQSAMPGIVSQRTGA